MRILRVLVLVAIGLFFINALACASSQRYKESSTSPPLGCCGDFATGTVITSATSLPISFRARLIWESDRPDGDGVCLDAAAVLTEIIRLSDDKKSLLDRWSSGRAATTLTLICVDPPVVIESQLSDRQRSMPRTTMPFFVTIDPDAGTATSSWPPGIEFGTSLPPSVRSRVLRVDDQNAGVWVDAPERLTPVVTWWGRLEFEGDGDAVRVVPRVTAGGDTHP